MRLFQNKKLDAQNRFNYTLLLVRVKLCWYCKYKKVTRIFEISKDCLKVFQNLNNQCYRVTYKGVVVAILDTPYKATIVSRNQVLLVHFVLALNDKNVIYVI